MYWPPILRSTFRYGLHPYPMCSIDTERLRLSTPFIIFFTNLHPPYLGKGRRVEFEQSNMY